MHDPMTVAFNVRLPLPWKTDGLLKSEGQVWAHYDLATIWHKDPCTGGSDDSCGWFKRAHHGDKAVLEKIVKHFEYDWDRVFKSDSGKTYFCGFFYPEDEGAGMPNLSTLGIGLNLFFIAALQHFGTREKAARFCQRHLFEILIFVENPTDSLCDSIRRKWGTDTKRADRIRGLAASIYGWILRQEQPWYRHARWHVWHWWIQVHALQRLWGWLVQRCDKCGGRFRYHESRISDYGGTRVWHERCDRVETPARTPARTE